MHAKSRAHTTKKSTTKHDSSKQLDTVHHTGTGTKNQAPLHMQTHLLAASTGVHPATTTTSSGRSCHTGDCPSP